MPWPAYDLHGGCGARGKSNYRDGWFPSQAGGACLNGVEASILYPGTVSMTFPGTGPLALPHQLFSAATLYRVASRSYMAPPKIQFSPSLPNAPPPRSITALAVQSVAAKGIAVQRLGVQHKLAADDIAQYYLAHYCDQGSPGPPNAKPVYPSEARKDAAIWISN